jgi:glycosyltransferase involved in cell wall biosynthesis
MEQHKIIIAGVGRSGTTFIFEEVAAALKAQKQAQRPPRFFYEPYLWAPAKVNQCGAVHHEPFDTGNLSPFGIYVHCTAPLFLNGAHPVHDQMIGHLFGHGDPAMAKMIRGNGRLRAYLAADPDLRVLGMTRDVFGTVNSAANHFSFFGGEFHPTDQPRFRAEVEARYDIKMPVEPSDEASRQAVRSACWWQYMTEALLEAKAAYPDRVCIVDYGSLRVDPDGAYQTIDRFLGLPVGAHRLRQRVGIVSSSNYLSDVSPDLLAPFHQWSQEIFEAHAQAFVLPGSSMLKDFEPTLEGGKPGVVPRYPLSRTVVGWRYALARRDSEYTNLQNISELGLLAFADAAVESLRARLQAPALVAGRPKVSVIIPVWNGAQTLEAAVASVWAQKDVNAEVVLVEDVSSDTTADLAGALLEKGPGRLLRNQRNLGPALSRHKGIMAAAHPLISTLDADDLMLPLKLAAEVDVIAGDPGVVGFSDVLYRRGKDLRRWTYDHLTGLDRPDLIARFAARKTALPRDMTLHRSLYARTRGFDTLLRMYEDWAFKIELAGLASAWRPTGEIGTCYAHKHVGQSAGAPPKHWFWMTAAYLRNADALALQFGARSIDFLQNALSQFGVPDYIDAGLDVMRRRREFSGNIIGDFDQMRRSVDALIARPDLDFETRTRRVYDELSKLPVAAE